MACCLMCRKDIEQTIEGEEGEHFMSLLNFITTFTAKTSHSDSLAFAFWQLQEEIR